MTLDCVDVEHTEAQSNMHVHVYQLHRLDLATADRPGPACKHVPPSEHRGARLCSDMHLPSGTHGAPPGYRRTRQMAPDPEYSSIQCLSFSAQGGRRKGKAMTSTYCIRQAASAMWQCDFPRGAREDQWGAPFPPLLFRFLLPFPLLPVPPFLHCRRHE